MFLSDLFNNQGQSNLLEATRVTAKERILNPGIKVGDTVYIKAPGYDYTLRTAKFLRIGPSGLATVKLSAPLDDNSNVPDYFKGATTLAVPPAWLHSDVDAAWPKPEWLKRKEQQQESRLVGDGPDLTVSVDLQESENKMKSSEFIKEAKGLKKKVRIVKGPKDAVGKVGYIGEIRRGMFKGAPKTYTVDYDDGTGNITSIQLPGSSLRLIKAEGMTESKVPTAKQVEAAKEKYESYGLKIENARKKAGYARGTGTVGDLQRKKGEAYTKYLELKKAFDSK